MDKKRNAALSLVFGLATMVALPAHAYLVTTQGGITTTTAGAVTFADFDSPTNPAYASITGGTLDGGASPGGGGSWLCATASGFGCSVVTINFTGLEDYFGLLWGSQDGAQNILRLYNGATLLDTIFAPGSGGIGVNSFVNITASSAAEYFNKIELTTSTGVGFEVDNLAVRQAVPEPLSAALLGLGLAALGFSRRKKA